MFQGQVRAVCPAVCHQELTLLGCHTQGSCKGPEGQVSGSRASAALCGQWGLGHVLATLSGATELPLGGSGRNRVPSLWVHP